MTKPNQAWCSDITYIPMKHGFVYLVAMMDWHGRFIFSWELSNTIDVDFCIAALDTALAMGRPEIFNTDQGSQFTSHSFVNLLQAHEVKISMDGKERAMDNIFIERVWRSLKYEDVYPHRYETPVELYHGLDEYFRWYNTERPHAGLDNRTPYAIFSMGQEK